MGKLRLMGSMMKPNWKTFASYEIFFRLLTGALFPPLFRAFFDLVLRMAGVRYVTAENITLLLHTPVVWLGLFLFLFLFAALELIELGGLTFIIDQSRRKKTVGFLQTLLFSLDRFKSTPGRSSRGSNLWILPVIMVLTPFFHLVTAINMFWSFSVFGRILRMIRRDWVLSLILVCLFFLFLFLFMRWRYAVHYFFLERKTAFRAMHGSSRLGRLTSPWQMIPMVLLQLLIFVGYAVLILVVLLVSTVLQRLFSLPGSGVSTFQVVFLHAAVTVFDALTVPLMMLLISMMFYENKKKRGEKIVRPSGTGKQKDSSRTGKIRNAEWIILVLTASAAVIYLISVSRSQYFLRIEKLHTMQVTAHRGASMFYPENTMAAFRGAVDRGTDWIELDVQESADGQIFVMHDTNFKRTTGLDKNAWELTIEEISQLDAGSYFSPEYEEDRIPLLSEVLEFAKTAGVKLNIELKPTGHEKNLVPAVIALVEEAGYADNCVITSQSYRVIQEVKQQNEQIQTVYVMGLAYGAINRLQDADAFSIRSTSISRSLVRDLHNRGIQVYAWTVDSRKNINRMINMGVDNIITNNVSLAVECINDSKTSNVIAEMMKSIKDVF